MANRADEKEARRQARVERERSEAQAAKRKRLVGFGVGGLLVAAAVVALVVALGAGGGGSGDGPSTEREVGTVPARVETDLAKAVKAAGCTDREFPSEGGNHIENESREVAYKSNPPHSGDHDLIPAEDGVYEDAPRKEALVHALEHGRVIYHYRPDTSGEVKANLNALFDEDAYHLIIAPNNTDMEPEVAATAWTRVLACPKMNDRVFDALRAFRDEYRDKAPERVP